MARSTPVREETKTIKPVTTISAHLPERELARGFEISLPAIKETPAWRLVSAIIKISTFVVENVNRSDIPRVVCRPENFDGVRDPVIAQLGFNETRFAVGDDVLVVPSKQSPFSQVKSFCTTEGKSLLFMGYGFDLTTSGETVSVGSSRIVTTHYESRHRFGTYIFDSVQKGCASEALVKTLSEHGLRFSQLVPSSPSAALVLGSGITHGISLRGIMSGASNTNDGIISSPELSRDMEVHRSLTFAERDVLRTKGINYYCCDILCSRHFADFFNANVAALKKQGLISMEKNIKFSPQEIKMLRANHEPENGMDGKTHKILRTLLDNMMYRAAAGAAASVIQGFYRDIRAGGDNRVAFVAHMMNIDSEFHTLVQTLLDIHLGPEKIILVPKHDRKHMTAEMLMLNNALAA